MDKNGLYVRSGKRLPVYTDPRQHPSYERSVAHAGKQACNAGEPYAVWYDGKCLYVLPSRITGGPGSRIVYETGGDK